MSGFNNSTRGNFSFDIDFHAMVVSFFVLDTFIILLGTTINLWMLVALLTSVEIRTRLRNKLICVILINNLTRASFLMVLEMVNNVMYYTIGEIMDCTGRTFLNVVRFTLMCIENWYILILLLHYLLAVVDFDPARRFSTSPRLVQIATVLILVGPWVLSTVVSPSVMAYHSHRRHGVRDQGCLAYTVESYKTLKLFGNTIPFCLVVASLLLVVVLYCRRQRMDRSMTSLLVGVSSKTDDIKMYIATCGVYIITDSLIFLTEVGKIHVYVDTFESSFVIILLGWYMSETQAIFVPLTFLLMADIRYRVKTYRPWYRPGPGIDLTVQYNRDDDAE